MRASLGRSCNDYRTPVLDSALYIRCFVEPYISVSHTCVRYHVHARRCPHTQALAWARHRDTHTPFDITPFGPLIDWPNGHELVHVKSARNFLMPAYRTHL